MDFVQPKKIVSPFSGEWSNPRLVEKKYKDQTVVEAYWYCPSTGKYITRGVVSITPHQSESTDNKK